jgi:hypothetical protein
VAIVDQPKCAEPDKDDPSVTVTAQRLIRICRKLRFDAQRLIVRLTTHGL